MNKKIFFCLTICVFFTFSCFSALSVDENGNSKDEEITIKSSESESLGKDVKQEELEKVTRQAKEVKKTTTPDIKIEKKTKRKTTTQTKTKDIDGIKELLNKIKEAQKERIVIKADLTITTTYIDVNNKQEVKGDMLIKKPDKFLVHYKEPAEQILLSDGKNLWIYTPELKQVIKQNIKEANLNTHFYIEFETSIDYFSKNSKNILSEIEEQYIIKMIPLKNKSIDFDEIISKINKKTLIPESMSMKFENTLIEVKFSNIETFNEKEILNKDEFKDINFEFKKPEDVEEIEASSLLKAE